MAPNASAADRNQEFAAALRERGWHDTAVDYLGWVEASPLMTEQFRQQLPYERAQSLAAQARSTGNRGERERLLGEAATAFQAFADDDPESPVGIEALRQAANLVAEQGFSALAAARQLPRQAAAQRDVSLAEARQRFADSARLAERIEELCTTQIAALPKATVIQSDPEAKARRDRLRSLHAEARYLRARLLFEQAVTHAPQSAEFEELLNEASRRFGALNEEFRGSVVGDSSRFYQGRCNQELGAFEKALGCYEDVIRNPPADPEFRRVAARAHRRTVECLLAVEKTDDAIRHGSDWLSAASPSERQEPDWLETAYRLAEAYQQKLKAVEAGGAEAKRLQSEIRTLLRDVAKASNEFQQDARLALAATSGDTEQPVAAKSFDEALAAGKSALEMWNSANLAVRLATENNPDAVEELKQQADQNLNQAQNLLEQALVLADRQTPINQLNSVRYYLAVLYWEQKELYDAAVLAEFLATRYPESEFASGAARIAFYGYEQLSIQSQGGGRSAAEGAGPSYEAQKLANLAELIATRWPDTREAGSAVNVLIQTALREERLGDAEALLARLPAESRGAAELSLGAGLWTRYLRSTAGQPGDPAPEAIELRDKAGKFLASGFGAVRTKGNPTALTAAGALYLAQFQLAQGDAASALQTLQDESVGPLSLVEAGAAAGSRPEFVIETYKTALRAFLSTQPPQHEQMEQVMAALETAVGRQSGESADRQLTGVYLGLGVQLQRQMQELEAAGQPAQAEQVASAVGELLERISSRPDANTWRVRGWLAQTNLQIGQTLTGAEAKAYAERARDAYEAMLAATAQDPGYAPDAAAVLGVRIRLGECLAALGQYEQAMAQYGKILREKPNLLDLQQVAATTLQQWGVAKRDPAILDRAIRGDLPQKNGKNLIWGWLRLAAVAESARSQATADPGASDGASRAVRFQDIFFESRYNVARTRYLAGTIAPAAARREHLQSARTNIDQMARLYPELGGEKWKTAFSQLRAQIDKELAKK